MSWRQQAACRDLGPDIFYPAVPRLGDQWLNRQAKAEAEARAKAICAECPTREPCLEYALELPGHVDTGIWGGLNRDERRRLRSERRQQDLAGAAR